jgi:hypothetical protein
VSEELGSGLSAMIPLAGGLGRSAFLLRTWVPGYALLFADLDQGANPSRGCVAGDPVCSVRRRGERGRTFSVGGGGYCPHDNDELAYRKRHVAPLCDIGHISYVGPDDHDHDHHGPIDYHDWDHELLVGHHSALYDYRADHLSRAHYHEHEPAVGTVGHRSRHAPEFYERAYDNGKQYLDDFYFYDGTDNRLTDRDHRAPRHDHVHRAGETNYVNRADYLDGADLVDDGPGNRCDLEPSAPCDGPVDGNLGADLAANPINTGDLDDFHALGALDDFDYSDDFHALDDFDDRPPPQSRRRPACPAGTFCDRCRTCCLSAERRQGRSNVAPGWQRFQPGEQGQDRFSRLPQARCCRRLNGGQGQRQFRHEPRRAAGKAG